MKKKHLGILAGIGGIAVLAVAGAYVGRLLRSTPSPSPSPAQARPVEGREELPFPVDRSTAAARPKDSTASAPEAAPPISEEQARKLAQGYRRAAFSNLHRSEPKPSETISCTLKRGNGGKREWLVRFSDETLLRLDATNGLLERFQLGRTEQGSLCTETGRCDGMGPVCTAEASKLALDLTRKRAEEFTAAANPPAALGEQEAKSGSGSPHYFRDSISWKKENAQNLTVEVEPYTGDVVHFELKHVVTFPPASVTKEAAIVTAVDALRKKYPKHFAENSILSIDASMIMLWFPGDGRESPVWCVAVKVTCRCSEPVHEKFYEQCVHPVTGQAIDWTAEKYPR